MSKKVDLSEFYEATKGSCKTLHLVEILSVEDQEKFEAACAESTISVSSLSKWLTEKTGVVAKDSTTRLHRLRKCACE